MQLGRTVSPLLLLSAAVRSSASAPGPAHRSLSSGQHLLAKMADITPNQGSTDELIYPRINGQSICPEPCAARRVPCAVWLVARSGPELLTALGSDAVFGEELQPVPSSLGPVTGFFRNSFCDASP